MATVQAYPLATSVTAGTSVTICVQPGTPYFQVAFYQQGSSTATLTQLSLPIVLGTQWVTQANGIFTSPPTFSQGASDIDWQWPRITFALPSAWTTGVYFAVVYAVSSTGTPTDAVGQAVAANDAVLPINYVSAPPTPPNFGNSMALFVIRPAAPVNDIAYVLSTSTYHAYNSAGGYCFYYGNTAGMEYYTVTLRRPGGGVGEPDQPAEADPYDTTSRRQTYAHWDMKFITWLLTNDYACDFYTDDDFDGGGESSFLLGSDGSPAYSLVLSVGHHEYWSQNMRDNLTAYLSPSTGAGGNVAVFSGNTCYRPIDYDPAQTFINRLATQWNEMPPPTEGGTRNESSLLGVTWARGNGKWVQPSTRPAIGYQAQTANQPWAALVFANLTGTQLGTPFGQGATTDTGQNGDHLVGYECDGVWNSLTNPAPPGSTPVNYNILAIGECQDVTVGTTFYGWDQWGGAAYMGIYGNPGPPITGALFNCATTDWARVLTCTTTNSNTPIVAQITTNVIEMMT